MKQSKGEGTFAEDKQWQKDRKKMLSQNVIAPIVQQLKNVDEEFKNETIAEIKRRERYRKNPKLLEWPKEMKHLNSLQRGDGTNSHSASASDIGAVKIEYNHDNDHDHAHDHDNGRKSRRQQKMDLLSYTKLQLFLNENHPRKFEKDKDELQLDSEDENDEKLLVKKNLKKVKPQILDPEKGQSELQNRQTKIEKLQEEILNDTKFNIYDNIGNHCHCNCFSKQKITPMAHQIGLGPTLFLLATKALAYFFFFLTILNIPIFVFYYNANPVEVTKPAFLGVFSALSIGNIAQRQDSCDIVNIAIENVISLNCPAGNLQNIQYYGFSKENEATCIDIRSAQNPLTLFENECYTQYNQQQGESSEQEKARMQALGAMEKYYYSNCFGENNCKIHLDTGNNNFGILDTSGKSAELSNKDSTSQGSSSSTNTTSGSSSSTVINQGNSSTSGSTTDTKKTPNSGASVDNASPSGSTSSSGTSGQESTSTGESSGSKSTNSDAAKPTGSGSSRLLAQATTNSTSNIPVDLLSQLSPVCKSIVQGRVYKSKYATNSTKSKIISSGVEIKDIKLLSPEPWLIFSAECNQDTIVIDQNGYKFSFKKEDLGIIVVFIDFAVILFYIYFVFFLNSKQNEYVEAFEEQTIEMSDFALEFSFIPTEEYYDGKEHMLRAIMWDRFDQILEDQMIEDSGNEHIKMKDIYNIIDITFATSDTKDIEHLQELKQLYTKLNGLTEELDQMDLLHEHHEDEFHSHKKKWDILPCCPGNRIDRIEKEYAGTLAKYRKAKEHYKLFHDEKQSISKSKIQTEERPDIGKQSITKAYVTFKSMTALDLMRNAYNYSKLYRLSLRTCSCICKKRYNKMRMREFQGRWPSPRLPDLPDNIQWENMGVFGWQHKGRWAIAWIISIFIIIVAFGAILIFKQIGTNLSNDKFKLVPTKFCAKEINPESEGLIEMILEQQMAWLDYEKPIQEQKGLLNCYCYDKLKSFGYQNYDMLNNIDFPDYKGKTPLCREWFDVWFQTGIYKYAGTVLVLGINLLVPLIIDAFSKFQRLKTRNDETQQTFYKVTFLSYFNVAVVILLVNFNYKFPILNNFQILEGKYKDFSERWYANIGANICWTLLLMVGTPQATKLKDPVIKAFLIWYDRGFKFTTIKDITHKVSNKTHSHEEWEDQVNSRQLTQDTLNNVYLGPEIKAYFVYAQQFTSLWCIMTYSSGMPILYPIGCLNFFVLYFVYKYLLIKFYSKTKSFNQVLPQSSIAYFRFGLVCHILVGMWVYSNGNVLSVRNTQSIEWFKQHVIEEKKYINIEKYPFMQRFVDGVGFLYFMFGGLVLSLIIFQIVLTTLFTRVFRLLYLCITCGSDRGSKEQLDEQEISRQQMKEGDFNSFSNDFIMDLKLNPLKEFYHRSNKELEIIIKEKAQADANMEPLTKKKKEADRKHQGLSDEDQIEYEKLLDQKEIYNTVYTKMIKRHQNFLDVFTSHISTLIYETGQEKENLLERLSPEQQLMFIEKNFFVIQRSKKGKDALRMEGICQSYNAKDSVLYRDLKFMQTILDGTQSDDLEHAHKHGEHGHEHANAQDDVEKNKTDGASLLHYDSQHKLIGLGIQDDVMANVTKSIEMVPQNKFTPSFVGEKIAKIGIAPSENETKDNILNPNIIHSNQQEIITNQGYGSLNSNQPQLNDEIIRDKNTTEPRYQNSALTPMSNIMTISNQEATEAAMSVHNTPPNNMGKDTIINQIDSQQFL